MATRPGLRLTILLALAGVIVVAYVPLFFAIAQVTRATSLAAREEAARALGRAIKVHIRDSPDESVRRTLASHVGDGGAVAIALYDGQDSGEPMAIAGSPKELATLRAPTKPYAETFLRVAPRNGSRALDLTLPIGDRAVVLRVRTSDETARSIDVVRGVALYMGVFALALLVFAYIALTRAIVSPIEQLARAADRVASGARSFDLPDASARELQELGSSVRAMALKFIADERALREKVEELSTTTRHLGETRTQLEGSERMASVGRLAAGVAHEIGNPITAIMGMHELLDDKETPEDIRVDFLQRMRKETERIHVVVRDLLDYARPESASPSTAGEASAHVRDVVEDVVALVRPQKDFRDITLTIDIDSGLRVLLSPQRLTQVFLNLLLNAAAALAEFPHDSAHVVTIRARTSTHPHPHPHPHPNPHPHARIEVEDNGPGVPADLREQIFDPFVTTKDVGTGTGLGLAVCKGIVESASGRVFVDASHTQGARFVLELPVQEGTPISRA